MHAACAVNIFIIGMCYICKAVRIALIFHCQFFVIELHFLLACNCRSIWYESSVWKGERQTYSYFYCTFVHMIAFLRLYHAVKRCCLTSSMILDPK